MIRTRDGQPSTGDRSVWLAYALATLGAVALGVVVFGAGLERTAGMFGAWLVQAAAFWRLEGALRGGADALRPWVGGIVARAGGLLATGAPALAGAWSPDVPVTYAVTMLFLLLAEAGWLAVGGPGGARGRSARANRIDRTHTTG